MLPLHPFIFAGMTSFEVFGQYISTIKKLRFLSYIVWTNNIWKVSCPLALANSNAFTFGHVGLKHSCHGNQVKRILNNMTLENSN